MWYVVLHFLKIRKSFYTSTQLSSTLSRKTNKASGSRSIFIVEYPSYIRLMTALYSRASSHIASDPVFGVKTSLVEDFVWREDRALAKAFGITMVESHVDGRNSRGFWLLERDLCLCRPSKQADWSSS